MDGEYVVIGAGSADCVIASRLSETGARVTLLEAGPRDWHPMIHIPAGVLKLLHHPVLNWNYSADAGPGTADRAIHLPHGKVLGGSTRQVMQSSAARAARCASRTTAPPCRSRIASSKPHSRLASRSVPI